MTDYLTEKQRVWWEIDLFTTFVQSATLYDKGYWRDTEITCLDPNFRWYWELWDREASVWWESGGEELSFVMLIFLIKICRIRNDELWFPSVIIQLEGPIK